MPSLLVIGLTNALVSAILGAAAYAITRLCKNPHVARALWLVVLLKLVTPPLVNLPLPNLAASDGVGSASVTLPTSDGLELRSGAANRSVSDMAADAAAPQAGAGLRTGHGAGPQESFTREVLPATSVRRTDSWLAYIGMLWVVGSFSCGLIACGRIQPQ